MEHKFKLGQVVEARRSMNVYTPPGAYEVTRLPRRGHLPHRQLIDSV
jgi:hypothetical protein